MCWQPAVRRQRRVFDALRLRPAVLSEPDRGRSPVSGAGRATPRASLAAQVAAAEPLRAAGEARVGLLFVVGEERGSDGARVANEPQPRAADS